jgi:hypothetical protein
MDYQGEPLFTLRGTVTVPKEFAGDDLVPVLTFTLQRGPAEASYAQGAGYAQEIVDVAVEGSFPSEFRLDIYEPPPESALYFSEGLPNFAVGHVTAMARSHPSRMKFIALTEGGLEVDRYCTFDESRCFERRYRCTSEGPSDCTLVSTSGDPGLKFAGHSMEVTLTYAPEPIEADSAIAFLFGTGEAIPAGYNLFGSEPVQFPPASEVAACLTEALEKANEDYNAAHGTNHSADESTSSREFPWEFYALERVRMREGGCPMDNGIRRVLDPANTPLTITLGPLDTEAP